MKKILLIFIALTLAFFLLGFSINWREYLLGFKRIPNFLDLLYEAREILESIPSTWSKLGSAEVVDMASFFNAVGIFFESFGKSVWAVIYGLRITDYRLRICFCLLS